MWTDLATSGSCLTSNRRSSVFKRMAQQGKHASNKMKIDRCRMTPTLSRFPLPKVWNQSVFLLKTLVSISSKKYIYKKAKTLTWEIRVSHADAKPAPIDIPRTLITWGTQMVVDQCVLVFCFYFCVFINRIRVNSTTVNSTRACVVIKQAFVLLKPFLSEPSNTLWQVCPVVSDRLAEQV